MWWRNRMKESSDDGFEGGVPYTTIFSRSQRSTVAASRTRATSSVACALAVRSPLHARALCGLVGRVPPPCRPPRPRPFDGRSRPRSCSPRRWPSSRSLQQGCSMDFGGVAMSSDAMDEEQLLRARTGTASAHRSR